MSGFQPPDSSKKIVLIVDDNQMIRRMLWRNLKNVFDEVLTAADPDEADRLLRENRVTHLLCDCDLGHNAPLGCDLVPAWRKMQPSISRAVIFTGSDVSNTKMPPEVDCVVPKTEELKELITALKI
jgi:DNA-binding NtrC family response regulator